MQDNHHSLNRLTSWLRSSAEASASDAHIVVGYPPIMRVHGELHQLNEPPLEEEDVRHLLMALCPPDLVDRFLKHRNIDFAYQMERAGKPQRYRANYFISGDRMGACFRIIPQEIPQFNWAGFPVDLANRLAHFRNGLVLITGVTGAGKTTTLAMMINLLNQEGSYRIITIEEPIEYIFPKTADSIITQREVGSDVATFADGLKYGLRQDPDVLLVGEIRDRDTGQMALSAAETGHLVFSTMHTRDAKGAISRYADLFPQSVQTEIRSMLSFSLRAVISQHLLPSARAGEKRELALEVLFNNNAIASAIRLGKIESIDNNIVIGRSEGMLALDESIKRLLQAGRISQATAEYYVSDRSALLR